MRVGAEVGVRELKAHLSEFLERAAAGEVIRVTDRGVPKAILGPLPGLVDLSTGVAEGWIRSGDGSPPLAPRRHPAPVGGVLQALAEDREEP